MVKEIRVEGYKDLKDTIKSLSDPVINIYFTGSKDERGISWCPDCVDAEPHVRSAVANLKKDDVFITVAVGDRPYWKDMKNQFRTDKEFNVQVIPTLIRWKTPLRLEGGQCTKSELLDMFFTDTD